ncbi:MAG: methylmalonyl-CoA epimerase [Actinomycetota bacterium]|jgi:methylmalonyl-CoA/ethylmalonyl-CoA epimerase
MPAPQEVIKDLVIGIDHIGLAAKDLDQAILFWQENFGAKLHSRELNAEQDLEEAMMLFQDGTKIQLLASTNPESTIGKFISKHGEGMQQLALRVVNLEQATKLLAEAQISSVYPAQKMGSNGTWINFIHPKFTGGVLIELVEYPS